MHVNCPYGCLQKMLNAVSLASLNLFTVIGHHPIYTEIDI